jgi:outer membrane phospholipase A
MKISSLQGIVFATLFIFCGTSLAAQDWLIASRTESIGIGQKIELEVVKPEDTVAWPQSLRLKLSHAGSVEEVMLEMKKDTSSTNRRIYSGRLQQQHLGVVHAELVDQPSNRILLLATDEEGIAPTVAVKDAAEETGRPLVVLAQPGEEPALSAYEPAYFVGGSNSENGKDAKFQISFKYRLFDPQSSIAEFSPMLSNLYFTYTQTTVWDLGGDSSPFRDTSYKPGIFYRLLGRDHDWRPEEYRFGLEHESNGQGGEDSRAINIAYVRPTWNFDLDNGKRLSFFPKIYGYLTRKENEDIQQYRGYVDWQMRYGREDGLIVNGLYRQGTGGYMTGQLDFSYPLSERIFARTGAFVHLQLFSGYGETLIDYNREHDTQLRVGISLVR